ncbi:MAG: hypothetical protein AAF335_04535, partial [Bacteroidota bacterium]
MKKNICLLPFLMAAFATSLSPTAAWGRMIGVISVFYLFNTLEQAVAYDALDRPHPEPLPLLKDINITDR